MVCCCQRPLRLVPTIAHCRQNLLISFTQAIAPTVCRFCLLWSINSRSTSPTTKAAPQSHLCHTRLSQPLRLCLAECLRSLISLWSHPERAPDRKSADRLAPSLLHFCYISHEDHLDHLHNTLLLLCALYFPKKDFRRTSLCYRGHFEFSHWLQIISVTK